MRTFRWLALPLIGVALFSAACGDDGGEEGGAEETATSTESTESTDTEATETSTAESTATESTESTEGDADALAEAFAGFDDASFNVTYQMGGDSAGETLTGEWKWVQDAEGDRTRFEIEADGQTVIMITTPEQSLVCAEGGCFDAGAMGGDMAPGIGSFQENVDELQAESSTASVTEVDGREIAGHDTKCVEFEDEAEGVTGTACYAEDGIPLLIDSTTAEGSFTMEATEYSTDVSDADFEAPFPITTLGQ